MPPPVAGPSGESGPAADGGDQPLAELAGLGAAAREEWRADEEEWGRAAVEQWTHGRGLLDVARELMHRGDAVAVVAGDTTFTGTITYVGSDVLQVHTGGGLVDVHTATPVVLRVVTRARAGGRRPGAAPSTFRARLLERESDAGDVVVGSMLLRDELKGRLRVGADHVVVRDDGGPETYVPMAWISWVASAG